MTEEELKAQEAAAAKKAEEEAAAAAAAEAEKEKAEAKTIEELPEHLREYVRGLRREAASYRTSANEYKAKLEAAGTDAAAKLAAAEALIAEQAAAAEQTELDSAIAALGLPAEAAAILNPKASTADKAAALAALAGGNRRQVIVDGNLRSRRSAEKPEATNGGDLMRDLIKNGR